MGRVLLLVTAAAALAFANGPQAAHAVDPTDLAMVCEAQGTAAIPATGEKEDPPPEPEPDISKDLEQDLQALIQELKKLGKDANEKIQKEVLPRIQEEIRKLREQLRDWQLEDGESEPPETRSI